VRRWRHRLAAIRLALAVPAGAAVMTAALVLGGGWAVAVTGGWSTTALVLLASIWLHLGRMDARQTAAQARVNDFSRSTADLIVLAASVASLVSVSLTLVEAGRHHGADKALLIALAFASVALSWASVHTIYALRYGDLYYSDPGSKGIDFPQEPDYLDFAYLALTLGMTYQVSDTSLSARVMRRTAIRHALLSYLFGAVIVAVAINAVASLLK
jgi:uncharacterized membrane protein